MVEKSWTFEQVMAAQECFQANASYEDPSGPLYQWNALHNLDGLEQAFIRGNKFAMMQALRVCANHSLPMPDWLARAYIRAFDRVLKLQIGSWDDAFGRPIKKGTHLKRARKRNEAQWEVINRIREIQLAKPMTPIDEGLFERVGAEIGIGKTLCNKLYYSAKRRLARGRRG